jgi:hypothetical protein
MNHGGSARRPQRESSRELASVIKGGNRMNSDVLNLVLGMYILGAFALQARNWHSWFVLLIGVFVACMGACGGYEFTSRGHPGNGLSMYFGQVLMVFSSVIGGALAGTAFTELRAKSKQPTPQD